MSTLLILLVDDDELSLEIVGLQLAAAGHSVLKASTGSQAISLLDQAATSDAGSPDLLLTDLHMPDMDGAELCRIIRQNFPIPPRLVAMSASRPASQVLADFDDFMLKPLDLELLQHTVTRQSRTGAQASPDSTSPIDPAILAKLRTLMSPSAVDELLSAFISDTRLRLDQIEASASMGDTAAVQRCAHMIKGSAAMTGAVHIARAASVLETQSVTNEQQKLICKDLRCACDAIEGTLGQSARRTLEREAHPEEAHDHQINRHG